MIFGAAWAGLGLVFIKTIGNIWPAITVRDPASVLAGLVLIPMAFFLGQGLFYIPKQSRKSKPLFIREKLFALPLAFLPFPSFKSLEIGEALDAVTTEGDRKVLLDEARRRLNGFSLTARMALLLENRSPADIFLRFCAARLPRPFSYLPRLVYIILEPVRRMLRLWGLCSLKMLQASSPGLPDELTNYKRRLAYDLGRRAAEMEKNGFPVSFDVLLAALQRVRNNPNYGFQVGEKQASKDSDAIGKAYLLFDASYYDPRYYGLYLDIPLTMPGATFEELYDLGGEEDPYVFYPSELGKEVERVAELKAEQARLKKVLEAHGKKDGVIRLDGRPMPTWEISAALFAIDDELAWLNRRLAGHNRRARTSRLATARRVGLGWPERLEGLLSLIHFAEQGLETLKSGRDKLASAEDGSLTSAEFRTFYKMLSDIYLRTSELVLPNEFEVRGTGFYAGPPQAEAAHLAAGELSNILCALKERALTALLEAEAYMDSQWRDPSAGNNGFFVAACLPAPPAPQEPPPLTAPVKPAATIGHVYSMADRLGSGFGGTVPAAILLALLLWQSQTLGHSRVYIYNGLGREVRVEMGGREHRLPPYGSATASLRPNHTHKIVTTSGRALVEEFEQTLPALPTSEVYNIAGASPLMEWLSPREAGEETRFLGRSVWLTSKAEVFFKIPSAKENGRRSLVLSGYGDIQPAEMLAAFDDADERLALILVHARWDEPGSPWFWAWQGLMAGRPQQADMVIDRLRYEPDFLERCVKWLALGETEAGR